MKYLNTPAYMPERFISDSTFVYWKSFINFDVYYKIHSKGFSGYIRVLGLCQEYDWLIEFLTKTIEIQLITDN